MRNISPKAVPKILRMIGGIPKRRARTKLKSPNPAQTMKYPKKIPNEDAKFFIGL